MDHLQDKNSQTSRGGLVLVAVFGTLKAIAERSGFLEGRSQSPGGATQKSTKWRQFLQGDQRAR